MKVSFRQITCLVGFLAAALVFAACSSSAPNAPASNQPASNPAATNLPVPANPPTATRPPGAPGSAPPAPASVVTATAAAPQLQSVADNQSQPGILFIPMFDRLNLNTASGDDYVRTIPGLRSEVVDAFVQNRPYGSIAEFRERVGKSIDGGTVTEFERYVFVPIDINNSDAATLMQIPGVTDAIAAKLITARPYASNDFFLAALSAHLPPNDVTFAQNFLTAR